MNSVPQLLAIFEGEGDYFRCVFEGGDWSLGILSVTCSQHHDALACVVEQLEALPCLHHSLSYFGYSQVKVIIRTHETS